MEEAFHHQWLPTQEYEIPNPYAEQLKGVPGQNQVIHVHACVLAHRAANIKSNVLFVVTDVGSASWNAARLEEPEMKQNSEILCLSRAGDLRLLMPTGILACKGFSGISLLLLSPSCLKRSQTRPGFLHPSTCRLRNAARGCSMLEMIFVCAPAAEKLFVLKELPQLRLTTAGAGEAVGQRTHSSAPASPCKSFLSIGLDVTIFALPFLLKTDPTWLFASNSCVPCIAAWLS